VYLSVSYDSENDEKTFSQQQEIFGVCDEAFRGVIIQ
jgi:hypothetical protein